MLALAYMQMVVNNNKNKSSSSKMKDDYCHYQFTVRTSGWVLASGTDSTLTFYVWDHYGRDVHVSQDGSVWPWFESNRDDVLNFDGPCISQPCVLVVNTDGAGSQPDWLMSWLQVVVTGGGGSPVEAVTFYNGPQGSDGVGGTWLGPSNTGIYANRLLLAS